MDNLIQTGGAGGFGAVLGALMSFFGIKSKIDAVDKRVDRLTDVVAFTDTCDAKHGAISKQFEDSKEMQTEIRDDIKDILKEMRSGNGKV